ncbi:MAG: hypothetical protein PVJ27_04885 [Candidatus Brocadiaceae bacterium]|jgi:uncharacterized protein (TIGR00290 family)
MYAVASSGGKDSTLALHRARQRGLEVTHLFHVYGVEYGRVRFHGYRPEVLRAQARALGLDAIVESTRGGECFDEDFARALGAAADAGVQGILFGNVHLEDVRDYYRRHVEAAGLEYGDMLWGEKPGQVLEEFVALGFRAVLTSVWLEKLDRGYLGREIDARFAADLAGLEGVDPCGENGEYHSLVYDGPCFRRPLRYLRCGVHEERDHVFLDVRCP